MTTVAKISREFYFFLSTAEVWYPRTGNKEGSLLILVPD